MYINQQVILPVSRNMECVTEMDVTGYMFAQESGGYLLKTGFRFRPDCRQARPE
jgi:hypothetical protein